MAALWNLSLVPHTDPNGDPYAGAKAYFFDETTTTPRTTYTDSALAIPHDHPVVADASGIFPAAFLQAGNYRMRLETSAGVVIHDVDGISVPVITTQSSGSGGTDETLLWRTGSLLPFYGTGALDGYVRCNGRTIGDAGSGATERANADCEDLFLHLWSVDDTLTVSSGRGLSAAADWAAGKTIETPDFRGRAIVGLDGMGAGDAGRIPSAYVDNSETGDDLGATFGNAETSLLIANMPAHNHGGSTGAAGTHSHVYIRGSAISVAAPGSSSAEASNFTTNTNTAAVGDHVHTISSQGSGAAFSNLQPGMVTTIYIKL